VNPDWDLTSLERVSYVHKLYLLLAVWEAADRGSLSGDRDMDGSFYKPAVNGLDGSAVRLALTAHLTEEGLSWVTFR
jgi:hypothetical protein